MALIIQDMRSARMAEHLIEFVEASLYARGAAKAFLMRTELVNYKKVCRTPASTEEYYLCVCRCRAPTSD